MGKSDLLLWMTNMDLNFLQGLQTPNCNQAKQHLMPLHTTIHQLWYLQMQLLQILVKLTQVT
jgi:hypothetical protein